MKDLGGVDQISHISALLDELEYGSIKITVHDGNVTQIDTTEKKRFSMRNKSEPYKKKAT
ncbi:MAG TPA: YezD family protein [Virgibacillus sp.]|nr:YezD family protein [Virgibacillus sp.]